MFHRFAIAAVILVIGTILALVFWRAPDYRPSHSPATAQEQVWRLRFGHNMPADSAMHEAALLYAKTVAEKSGGRIQIEVFPNQQLGDDHKMTEMARRGMLDIVLIPTAKMSVALPSMQYVDLPFYFPAREDTYEMLDGEPGQMLLDELKQIDLVGVTFWENGFKHFTANTPLLRPEDFRGKKFRIMKSRLIQSQFETLGATTLPIDFHATRQALADGIVNAQENPLIAIRSMGIDEVQKHLTLSSHAYMGYVFCISAKTYKSLPQKFQKLLYETARDLTPYEREQTHKREASLLQQMQEKGLNVHTLSDEERITLQKAVEPIIPPFEEVIGSHILSKTEELLHTKYGPSPESGEQIVIGLNTDLSMATKIGGLAIKRGAMLAIEEINARGGVLGKPLVLIAKDNRGIAGKGSDNVKTLAARKDVIAILGGVQSGIETGSIQEARRAAVPYLIPWATAAELTDPSPAPNVVFRISANDRDAVAFMGEYLLRRYRSPAVLYENSVWGRGALARMEEISSERGRVLADAVVFNIAQQDFKNEIERLKRSRADSLLLIANSTEAIGILNTLDRQDVRLPIVSHWGITNNRFFEEAFGALKRTDLRFLQTFSFQAPRSEKSALLAHRYLKRYDLPSPEAIQAPVGVAQAYDLVHLLVLAIKKAGSTDREAVRRALEKLPPYEGAVRRYAPAFTPKRHDALMEEDYHLARFRADGTIVPARP
ncbi:MAG: DctP family TRAP transporter solute-binding subunit [Campylobacterales bacterium]|nr:DctP family TRAP transporter solute-binding subunit [Campylobacterales bacterium]